MARIPPLPRAELGDLEDVFSRVERALGFLPNSFLILARRPEILRAFSRLSREVIGVPGTVPLELKRLVAHVASRSAGCQYCVAHTAESAADIDGVPADKVAAALCHETSPLFSEAERAALRVANGAGMVPNGVTDADMAELRTHFDDGQVVELMAVICLFGWLNRWNDTLATDLEDRPFQFAAEHLAATGWAAGKHRAE